LNLRLVVIFVVFLFILSVKCHVTAQELVIDTSRNITRAPGDDLSPAWSPDGEKLLYQSDRNGTWDIYLYDLEKDTTIRLTSDTTDEQNPGFYPGTEFIYYDAGEGENRYLYKLKPGTGEVLPVFGREIACKDASFTPDGRMMYFLGYDEQQKKWALYSYHFVYDVLNKLADDGTGILYFDLAPDAKNVLYGYETYPYPYQRLKIMSWYGDVQFELDKFNIPMAVWHPDRLKIYFVSDKDNLSGEIYSIWKNNTHEQRLTDDDRQVRNLAVAPDGRKLACSVMVDGNYEIIIISLPAY
jgi:TolB protein